MGETAKPFLLKPFSATEKHLKNNLIIFCKGLKLHANANWEHLFADPVPEFSHLDRNSDFEILSLRHLPQLLSGCFLRSLTSTLPNMLGMTPWRTENEHPLLFILKKKISGFITEHCSSSWVINLKTCGVICSSLKKSVKINGKESVCMCIYWWVLGVLSLCCCTCFSPVVLSRDYSSCSAHTSHCSGISYCTARALEPAGFSSCGLWPQWLRFLGSRAQAQELWQGLSCPSVYGIIMGQGSTSVSCIGRQILYHWSIREAPICIYLYKDGFYLTFLKINGKL